jgi:CBS domain-containing protein
MPAHPELGLGALGGALVVGLAGGLLAWLLTTCVYGSEDLFQRLPVHWMWWPAVGGLVVGIGGLIDPRALGVGYDSIAAMLQGSLAIQALVSLLVVKLVIWSVALGSGTSGGILAPLLIIGGALGGILAPLMPEGSSGIWALICMAATLAGVTRSPFTSVVFAVELTHEQGLLLPLFLACICAYAVSVLVLRRSILTEKVARRGFHVMREYAVDPLEALFARDVMATGVLTLEPSRPVDGLGAALEDRPGPSRQRLFPVVADDHRLVGVVGRREITRAMSDPSLARPTVRDIMRPAEVVFGDETLRTVADRMTTTGLWVMPVIDRSDAHQLLGLVAQRDLSRARERLLVEERHRERVLRLRPVPSGRLLRRRATHPGADADAS